jgi:Myb/SANT-like DNA-binding domain
LTGEKNVDIEKEIESTRAIWIEPQKSFLVSLLVEFSSREHRTDNGWTQRAWTEIVTRFKEKFPHANFTKAQIKDQEQRLKKKFKSLKRVLSMSGMGWNNDLKQIDPQDAVVEEALMNDKEARQWLGKSFPYYNDLFDVYKGTDIS